jgi:hypothetical protein
VTSPKEKPTRKPKDETPADVVPGEFVGVKDWVVRGNEVRMTPLTLLKIGWPNKFQVLETYEKNGKPALRLDPCCGWMKKPGTEVNACEGHPAGLFVKNADAERIKSKDDRYSSLEVPWGEVLSLEYLEDEKMPAIVLRLAGGKRPFAVSGPIARDLHQRAKEFGLI